MKIVFICGCLEPGRDGVGDYTRLLATELITRGHMATAISLHDGFVKEEVKETQNGGLEVLRIDKEKSWSEKIMLSKVFVDAISPDFLSLQFVPFSFNEKGLPFALGSHLKKLTGVSKWHIMFHELWIENKDIKGRIVAYCQKKIIAALGLALEPVVVHTNLPVYKRRLATVKIQALLLPVISNIPALSAHITKDLKSFTAAFFSQITYRSEVILFLEKLSNVCEENSLEFRVLIIGAGKDRVADLKSKIENKNLVEKIVHTGFLSADELSLTISKCDLGISPVPQHVLGKSGSTAAFLSHSIPVAAPYIKPGYEDEEIGLFNNDAVKAIVLNPNFEAIEVSKSFASKFANYLTPVYLAEQFLNDILPDKK